MDRCRCCHRPITLIARFGAYCETCAAALLHDVTRILDGPEAARLVLGDMACDAGCLALAKLWGGSVPFEVRERDGH